MTFTHDHLQSVLRVLDAARPPAAVLDALESTRQARGALPPSVAAMAKRSDWPVGATMAGLVSRAAIGPVGLTVADLNRVHSFTSRYATGLAFPTGLPSSLVMEQAIRLQSLASSLMTAVAVEPEPDQVFDRASEGDDEIKMLLSTLVAWTRQHTEQQNREHAHVAAVTYLMIGTVLIGLLQFVGYDRVLRALEALAQAIDHS